MIEELKIKLMENPSLYLFLIAICVISIFLLFLLLKNDNQKNKSLKSSKDVQKKSLNEEEFKENISEVPLPLMESAPVIKKTKKITLSKIKPIQILNEAKKIEIKDLILIVDDSNLSLKKLKKDIGTINKYEVVTKSNAFEAIDYLKETYEKNGQMPSLVISDIEMPLNEKGEGDGFFLLNHVKQEYGEGFPVILMTSNLDIFNERGLDEGVNGFLSKPFDKEIILQQIEFCLKN